MITIYNQNKIEIEILKKMEVFTKEVFEYYNGIINTISSKYMNLEITNYDCNINMNKNIFGYCKPNTITINLSKLIRFFMCSYDILYDYNSKLRYINIIKINILYIIIHELYHVDQIVDYNKYKDKQYRKYIEDSVEDISKKFIKDNIECIYNTFNIKFNINSKFLQYNYINYKSYNDKIEYINYLLNYLYHENKDYATILKTAYNISIKLIDKNKEYYIKKDNKFIIENLYQDNYTKYEYYKIEKKELNTIIIFSNNENIYK